MYSFISTRFSSSSLSQKCTFRSNPAFVQQIIPGVVGGVVSAMALYPLEVLETILQGEAAGARKSSDGNVTGNNSNTSPLRPSSAGAGATVAIQQARPARHVIIVATQAMRRGELLRGFDMAFLSAIIGFTVFFSVFELTSYICPGTSPATILCRNLFGAFISFIFNSPFQLLKTRVVLQGGSAGDALREATSNGKKPQELWRGFLANVLGISFIALQFTLAAARPATASPLQAALFGCAVTVAAALATYPVLTVRTAVMADYKSQQRCLHRIVRVSRKMWSEGTIYNGLGANLVRQIFPAFILFGIQSVLGG